MSGPIEHLETERLVLRPMTVGDVEEMHEIYSDETTFQFIAGGPCRSIDETLERVQEKIAHQKQQGFSLGVVIERSTGMVVGDCGLQLLEGGPDVEVGYKMARRVRGRVQRSSTVPARPVRPDAWKAMPSSAGHAFRYLSSV